MNENATPIIVGLLILALFKFGIVSEKYSINRLEVASPLPGNYLIIFNDQRLSQIHPELGAGDCGLSDQGFKAYVLERLRQLNIYVKKVHWILGNRFFSQGHPCIREAVIEYE